MADGFSCHRIAKFSNAVCRLANVCTLFFIEFSALDARISQGTKYSGYSQKRDNELTWRASNESVKEHSVAIEKATFGAGCFWGVETRFSELTGVIDTAVGYEGGHLEHPTYQEVCTDRTGHAEVVQVTFDPSRLPYEALLDVFFALHDPTQVNRQGPDWGTQYRSIIFTHSDEQAAAARAKIAELNASGTYRQPIATKVEPSKTFWKAEEYHQRYLEKRGMVSCHI
jgi:peptide-methionine (S)-S-oxide reductase